MMKSTPGYEESYIGQLRKLVGKRKLLTPAAQAIIRDETIDARLFPIGNLPSNFSPVHKEILADFINFDGCFILK